MHSFGGQPAYIDGRTATVLMNGTVLVAGGEQEDCGRFANADSTTPPPGSSLRTAT
jgi:hypothetical protein